MAVYGTTKGALASLTYSWALDLADHGIRVNAISPVADTSMTWMADIPVGKLPAPEANAPAVTFLLSDLAAGITGQVVQFRPPSTLEVVAHPQVTGLAAEFEPAAAGAVAAAFGPVLRENLQANGWGIGRS
jgi:NAD(P)-dependent dehydrogenase (short-subunit alcohol dehydrogenase family)